MMGLISRLIVVKNASSSAAQLPARHAPCGRRAGAAATQEDQSFWKLYPTAPL